MKGRRRWQQDFLEKYAKALASNQMNYLLYAGVGSGKTHACCKAAKMMLRDYRAADRMVVVTPTRHLVRQWTVEAKDIDLNLLGLNSNAQLDKGLPSDVDGYVVTYQGLMSWPDLHEAQIGRYRTFAILDEPHHLQDDSKFGAKQASQWGKLTKQALCKAVAKLLDTGTPLRTDGQPIPFVHYEPVPGEINRFELVPDFSYTYGKSVADGYCRPVSFVPFEGTVKWRRGADYHEATFADKLDPELEADRLRYATWVDDINEFLPAFLISANKKLLNLRRDDLDAGGLVVASDMTHARLLERELYRTTGQRATVVLSEDEDAQAKIAAFRRGRTPWLIAVRMVSEGVDIPRLRVLVYCTNVTSELFFIQVMGRIVRCPGDDRSPSFFFMPADPWLCQIAKKVEDEVKFWLTKKKDNSGGGGGGGTLDKEFLGAEGVEATNIVGGKEFEAELIEAGETLRETFPDLFATAHPAILSEIVRAARAGTKPEDETKTYDDEKKEITDKLNNKVKSHAFNCGVPFSHLWSDLFKVVGCTSLDNASLDQVRAMEKITDSW